MLKNRPKSDHMVANQCWFQSNNMVALHSDLKEGSSHIKLVFIKKGCDLHPISHWANDLLKNN